MDYQAIMSAISTVGFPIVMCCILLYMMNQQSTQHKDEMDKVNEALNNNTLAIQHLTDIIGAKNE